MTLSEVAAGVGVAPSAIAYYFESKEKLAVACIQRSIAVRAGLIAAAAEEATLEERLAKLFRTHFELFGSMAAGDVNISVRFDDIPALGDQGLFDEYTEMFRGIRSLYRVPEKQYLDRAVVNARIHLVMQTFAFAPMWLEQYNIDDYPRAGEITLDILSQGLNGAGADDWSPTTLRDRSIGDDLAAEPREVFLNAATRLISLHGYRGASIDRITAELGVTKGAFYHVLDTKDDLIEICFDRTAKVVRSAQTTADKLPTDGRNRLVSCLTHLVDHQLKGDVPLLRYATASLPEVVRSRVELGYTRDLNHFGAMVSDGIADGSLRPVNSHIGSQMISTVVWASNELANWLPRPLSERATEYLVRPLFEGIV